MITTDCIANPAFSLSNCFDVLVNESLEIKINNTSKDEIISIGNDITLVAFIITAKF